MIPGGKSVCTVLLAVALAGCAVGPSVVPAAAEIVRTGVLECYPAGLVTLEGKPVFCEASAVERVGGQIYVVSDKTVNHPRATSGLWLSADAFTAERIPHTAVKYDRRPMLLSASKIEAMGVSSDGEWVFATTDFDYPPDATAEPDPYNTLLYWPARKPDQVKIANPSTNQGVVSSISLRSRFSKALRSAAFPDGPPYFKIEGLSVLPGNRLLFGVREIGTSYEKFEYSAALIEVGYSFRDGELLLAADFVKAEFIKPTISNSLTPTIGLSSLMYDADRRVVWMLTSVEDPAGAEENSAYLWSFSYESNSMTLPLKNVVHS